VFLICVTHAQARNVEPQESFRALTEEGRADVEQAAARFLSILPDVIPDLESGRITIDLIVSSPLARCIETVIIFTDVIRRLTRTSDISVSDKLREKKGGGSGEPIFGPLHRSIEAVRSSSRRTAISRARCRPQPG
jgi:broad specificity phosphatase PhoE